MGELDGRVALITGGARGQGAAAARLFGEAGAIVVIADVLDEVGEQTAGTLGCDYLHLDVSSEEEWEAAVADILARHGRLDILLNNAGVFPRSRLINTPTEVWDRTIAINQKGVFLGMRTCARAMIDAGRGGVVINTSSVAGLEGVFGATAYGATKWAITGMTRTAAKELGKYEIRVNSIHPGLIETPMVEDMIGDQGEEMAAQQPLQRLGTVDDVAEMALFLASDRSSYCTGQSFIVDGGVHA